MKLFNVEYQSADFYSMSISHNIEKPQSKFISIAATHLRGAKEYPMKAEWIFNESLPGSTSK